MSKGCDNPYSDTLSPQAITQDLNTQWLGQRQIYCYDVVESTNTQAKTLAREGAPEGSIVLADAQTTGRGRLDRAWISPPRTGLYVSVILRPQSPPERAPILTFAAAVAAALAICETGLSPEVKWPNDIMVGGRKVGGILTEACFDKGHIDYVTVGLGINVKTKPEDFPASIRDLATSLSLHTNKPILRISVLQAFLRHLEHWYEVFCKGSFNKIMKAWRGYDMLVGHTVEVSLFHSKLLGVAEEVDPCGALLVRDTTGKVHRIIAGDVVRCRVS